jgi:hypothetical protein
MVLASVTCQDDKDKKTLMKKENTLKRSESLVINRRTDDLSHDAKEVLCDKLKNNSFSIQVD